MFNNSDAYDLEKIIQRLKSFWNLAVADISGDNNSAVFNLDGETVGIAFIPAQIPRADIEGTAKYAYNWLSAAEDLKGHTGHAIVTLMAGQKSPLERFGILSKVLCSILMTSKAVGVYKGSQSLLVPKTQYLSKIDDLRAGAVPTALWIYIGLIKDPIGNSGYTYGLKEFGKKEIEVIDARLDIEAVFALLSNIASYVIGNNITLRSGETMGYTKDQKIRIGLSKGVFVDGQSLKLEM